MMFGSLIPVGAGLVSSIEQALGGPGLTIGNPGISEGSIGLSEMEVPEKVTWGGGQQLAVHRLIGGQRVVDAMGPDDRTLDWSGLMRGPNAVQRARQMDALRNSGAKQVLSWADFTYTVVVQSFEADYTRQGYRIPYRISCLVIPQPPVPRKPGLLESITNDIEKALGIDGLVSDVGSALSQAQTVVNAALPVAAVLTGGNGAFLALSSAVGTASGAIGAAQGLAETAVGASAAAASAFGGLIGGADGLSGIAALQAAGTATASLASSALAGGYVARAVANLGSASP